MDWLKKLPVVGPLVERLMTTHAYRSYETLDRAHWARLAGAMTFNSFLALFPLLTLLAAVAAATLSTEQQQEFQDKISDQIPGISEQLDIGELVSNAGTVGVIAGVLLLVTGVSWVGSIRDCLRAVWGKEDEDVNPVMAKLKDAGILAGLGLTGLLSLAASAVGSTAAVWLTRAVGLEDQSWIGWLLLVVVFGFAVLADFLILLYVLTLLPGVQPPRRRLFVAALIGAIGFELLKLLIGGYMKGVAAKSMYGAFGVPVALLLWINFTAKLLLLCAAWTATQSKKAPESTPLSGGEAAAPGQAAASGG
ncbi:YihY/virulence factor BrkB family protein [Streptomyces sp. YC504]|uniref:YihY/virulence factor BrkB family protein n=1 Tax=Streptomyces mesophilus TaxID=1775132 RepID=A0A6G4XNL1_9ACTN|nr:YihY/virulence factor BrkB family protein [Streptomyces mesophilus]NGO79166.1 YihY/virulence factor BrkB family protein [Streptomyces mesophilus]